jgi:hypothetical protein
MSLSGSHAETLPDHRVRSLDLPVVLSLLVLLISPFLLLRMGMNIDASWIITMSERVLAGDHLYIDIIETNPPFTLWMYLPVVALAKWLNISPELSIYAYAYAVCLGGLAFAALIVRRAEFAERSELYAILPAFAALLVIFPGHAFTEREHFGIALLLPLLALLAWRATPDRARPGLALAIGAGVCGSVIVLIKPYYAVMILAPAIWVAWRRRSFAALFAPELLTIGFVCVAYLAVVYKFHPEFITDLYPMLERTYMRVAIAATPLRVYGPTIAIICLLIYGHREQSRLTPLTTIALLSASAGLIPLCYQGKGWVNHAYPAEFLFLSVLALSTWRSIKASRTQPLGLILTLVALVLVNSPYQTLERPTARTYETIRAAVQNPKVAQIGSGLESGHPLTRSVGGIFVGAYASDWLGAMALLWGMSDGYEGNAKAAAYYKGILDKYVAHRSAELKSSNPEIVVIQKRDEHWTDWFIAQPAMAGFMDRYELLVEDSGILV